MSEKPKGVEAPSHIKVEVDGRRGLLLIDPTAPPAGDWEPIIEAEGPFRADGSRLVVTTPGGGGWYELALDLSRLAAQLADGYSHVALRVEGVRKDGAA